MLKKIAFILLCGGLFLPLQAQQGGWSVSVQPEYSVPIGELAGWFKPAPGLAVKFGKPADNEWYLEYGASYVRYDEENLDAERKRRVDLFLEHGSFTVNGLYPLTQFSGITMRLNIGGGLYYWKGIRGRVEAEPDANPPIPLIAERKLEEWNWGFKGGLSFNYSWNRLELEPVIYYRVVIGELWPTLQPGIELENVSGLQSLNLALGIRYNF